MRITSPTEPPERKREAGEVLLVIPPRCGIYCPNSGKASTFGHPTQGVRTMRDLTKAPSGIALAFLAAGGLIGCGPMSQRTQCQIGVTGTGAALRAICRGGGTSQIEKAPVDDGEIAAGAAAGMVAGALVGWGLSYLICHEEEAPPPT